MSTVYVGNLDPSAAVRDLHDEFDRYGRISDVWVARKPPGFAFIEFERDDDARDAVKDMDGRYILDKRIRVEISRRGRGARDRGGEPSDTFVRGRSSEFKVKITGLPRRTEWKVLKDFIRDVVDPLFVDTFNNGEEGVAAFRTEDDVDLVISKLDDTKFEGSYISIKKDREGGAGAGGREGGGRDFGRDREVDRHGSDRGRSRSRDRDSKYRRDSSKDRTRRDRSRSA